MSNEKTPLTREIKIMLIEVLKAGEISKDNATVLADYLKSTGIIQNVTLTFKKYDDGSN
jgi:hypothetical protein